MKNKLSNVYTIYILSVSVALIEILLMYIISQVADPKFSGELRLSQLPINLAYVPFFGLFSVVLILYAHYRMSLFANALGSSLGDNIIQRLLLSLKSPEIHMDSAKFASNIFVEANRIALKVVMPTIELGTRFIVLVLFLIYSLLIKNFLPMYLVLGLLIIYIVFITGLRPLLSNLSKSFSHENKLRMKILQEVAATDIEIKINNLSQKFLNTFKFSGLKIAQTLARIHIIGVSPKLVIEHGILVLVCIFVIMQQYGELNTSLFNLSTVLLLLRILPTMHSIYSCLVSINGNFSALDSFKENDQYFSENLIYRPIPKDWCELRFEEMNVRQPNSNANLKEISSLSWNFTLQRKGLHLISGPSGSGKSTICKCLTGTHAGMSGLTKFDKTELSIVGNTSWFSQISYVSQNPILFAGTLEENITNFADFIDKQRVNDVMKLAGLCQDEALVDVDKIIEPFGANLSGGQKQRLAIARAVYRDSNVIILDEPTSALDKENESRIRDLIENLSQRLCVVLVSHSNDLLSGLELQEEIRLT